MQNLYEEISLFFNDCREAIINDKSHTSNIFISEHLQTVVNCSYKPCSDHLAEFSLAFNKLLNEKIEIGKVNPKLDIYILEDLEKFLEIDSIFHKENWTTNESIVEFNKATLSTSAAKCTQNNEYTVIKCYEHFYYINSKKTNESLILLKDEKKALTMVNILLLTPYLLYGDLFAVHGGLVSDGLNNILISNNSLGGKTTFAILFLENGWKIVTEETTYISKEGKILNFNIRNYFNIRAGTYLAFKDFFRKMGIINDKFLGLSELNPSQLFDIGKQEQMSIDFSSLSKNDNFEIGKITHALKVSVDKLSIGTNISKISYMDSIDRFLELSLAPTVLLFAEFVPIEKIDKVKRKATLTKIFQEVKNFQVVSGLDYRKNFANLLNEIGIVKD